MNNLLRGKIQLFEPTENIKYSYLVYVPEQIKSGKIILWCHGSTPPDPEDKLEDYVLRALSRIQTYCDKLNLIAVMPILPREDQSKDYPESNLDSQIMTAEVMIEGMANVGDLYKRPDITVNRIIENVRGAATELGISVEEKIIVGGVSAGGAFTNRFSVLYPHLVSMAILLLAGDFIYPNTNLDYPFGIKNLDKIPSNKFSLDEFKKIHHFMFVGENDTNDALPFELRGDRSKIEVVRNLLGQDPVSRTKNYADYLRSVGMKIELYIGEGLGHQLGNDAYDRAFQFIAES